MLKGSAQVAKLLRLVQTIREVEEEFPPQTLEILLLIAMEGTMSMSALQEKLGFSLGAVSRNLAKLAVSHNGVRGFGFITVDFAPGNYRQKVAAVTTKGLNFIDRLLATL